MDDIEVTSMSSRGQVVIPQGLRKRLGLKEGTKFVVVGEGDAVLLKKIKAPSAKDLDNLIEKTRKHAEEKNIKPSDLPGAIKRARE